MVGDRIISGSGRAKVTLSSMKIGEDLVVLIYNDSGHVGAAAVGEYDREHNRASVSVITRLGHKDDAIARKAAYEISKSLKKAVCVVAGVHLDNILAEEIDAMVANAETAVKKYLASKKSIE